MKRVEVEARYAPWLQTIQLPELRAKARENLVQRLMIPLDVAQLIPDPRASPLKGTQLRSLLGKQVASELTVLIGEEGVKAFYRFEASLNIRESLGKLATRLSYTEHPLTRDQQEALANGLNLFVSEDARGLFTPAQWIDVQEYGREIGLLPQK